MQNRRCGNCGCNNYSPVYQNDYREEDYANEKVQPRDFEYENEYENQNQYGHSNSCPKCEEHKKEHCQYFKEKKYWVEECIWKKCCKFRPVCGKKFD